MHELCADFKNICDVVRRVILLGTSAKSRKASIMFVITVCLSVRMEQLGSHWTDFREI